MRIVFLQMNVLTDGPSAPLRDLRVRQAINHAIDRDTMVKQIVGEGAHPDQHDLLPLAVRLHRRRQPRYPTIRQRRKRCWRKPASRMASRSTCSRYRDRSQTEAMVGYLRAVGIKANLQFMQYAAMRDLNRANKVAMSHQTWGSYSLNDISASVSVYFKGIDDDSVKDKEIIALIEKGDTTVDTAARKDSYKKALGLIADRAYAVPLYALTTYYIAAKDLDFNAYPDELPRFWEMKWK